MHHSHTKLFAGRAARCLDLYLSVPHSIIHDLQCYTIHIGTRKLFFCRAFLAGIGRGVSLAALRREGERAATSLLDVCFGNNRTRALGHRHLAIQVKPLIACGFEGYPIRHTSHNVSTFGEELQPWFGRRLVYLRQATKRAKGHLVEEVAWLLRLIKNREDTAVEFFIVLIILLRHAFIKEPLLGDLVVRMLRDAPVELPARVGSQLVIASVECILQDKASMHLSVPQLELLSLYEVAVLIQQLRIKDSAQSARRACIATTHVCLVIYGISKEIARVVHVHEDLFLWN